MADAARLVIEIEDRPGPPTTTGTGGGRGGGSGDGGDNPYPSGGAAEVVRNAGPAGHTHPVNATRSPSSPGGRGGGGGGGPSGPDDEPDPFREHISRAQQALRNLSPAGRSYEQLAKDSLAAGGRPADASDEEWLWYSRESGKRGTAAGRAAVKGAQARRKEEEQRRREMEAERRAEEEKAEKQRLTQEQQRATWAATAAAGVAGAATGEEGAGKAAGRAVGSGVGSAVGMAVGAAAGGPIGAAIGGALGSAVGGELGEKIGERIDDPFLEATNALNAMNKAVRFAGESFVKVAGNDGVGLFTGAVNQAADGLERLPVAGKVLAAEFRLIATTAGTAKAVLDAFAARGRELAGYSGPLAGAVARQDVALLLADIREANKLGDKLAKVIDTQTRLELFLREALLPLKEAVADRLPRAVETGIHTLEATATIWERVVPGFEAAFGKVSEDIARLWREAGMRTGDADLEKMWFAGLSRLVGPVPGPHGADPGIPMPAPVAAPFGRP